MIRVFYIFVSPVNGPYGAEHSMPVADIAQFVSRMNSRDYGIDGVVVTRVEEIPLTPPTKGEEEFYARWGTAGEF